MSTKSGASLHWGGLDKAMQGAVGKLANTKVLMSSIGEALVASTQKRFEDSEDPEGKAWLPSERAGTKSGKTLVNTAELKKSIDYSATSNSVMVGTNVPYARIHQYGGIIKPKKGKYLKFAGKDGKEVFVKEVTIPARPYLGLSKQDAEEVYATMGDFVAGAFRK